MKTLSLTKQQSRVLRMQLEQKSEGYTLGDLRKLDRVLSLLEDQCILYDGMIAEAVRQHRGEDSLLNERIEEINEDFGSQEISVSIEDAHFEVVRKIWSEIKSWSGQKQARKLVLAIDDALEHAITGTA